MTAILRRSACVRLVGSSRHAMKPVASSAARHLNQPKTAQTSRRLFKRVVIGCLNDVTVHAVTGATRYFEDLPSHSFGKVHRKRTQALHTRQDYVGHCLGVVAITGIHAGAHSRRWSPLRAGAVRSKR